MQHLIGQDVFIDGSYLGDNPIKGNIKKIDGPFFIIKLESGEYVERIFEEFTPVNMVDWVLVEQAKDWDRQNRK